MQRIIDVRLNNVSQLAGFAKKDDLSFFLKTICNCEYLHMPELAPTKEVLDGFKKKAFDWNAYTEAFNALLAKRDLESLLDKKTLSNACLLCSEATPEMCHRRLVAEKYAKIHQNLEIIHL